jgi:hypothetical protein
MKHFLSFYRTQTNLFMLSIILVVGAVGPSVLLGMPTDSCGETCSFKSTW